MVSPEDVLEAGKRIRGVARRTPVMTSESLDRRLEAKAFLKCENFQRMGAFKFRGAYNALSRLSPSERERGVVTYSSGNHAQAVALAGQLLGIKTTVVMPESAPSVKRDATAGYGASVVLYDPMKERREEIAERLLDKDGGTLIPPFDHEHIIAGAGTAALELFEETGPLDLLLVPCGGGGLLSGSALAARLESPAVPVVGVEPELGDDATRSFKSGVLQTVVNPPTIADGARTSSLGRLTFPLVRSLVSDMVTVSESEIIEATRFLWERMKLVVEPTGSLGLAAALHSRTDVSGKRIGIILSGGNVDLGAVLRLLSAS